MEQNQNVSADASKAVRTGTEDAAVIRSSLKVGAACGGVGFLVGGAAGIVRGAPPLLFATASGLQTFALGTTYWASRSLILQQWMQARQPSDLVKASAISGALTGGAVAALTRGRYNVLPGAIMFSLFGFLGQTTYNRFSTPQEASAAPKPGFWRRMSESRFSPVTVMSNKEYAELLREKKLRVEAEISIIDDRIAALREQHRQQLQQQQGTTNSEGHLGP